MSELFSLSVHYGEYFSDNPRKYVGGKVDVVDNCDPDRWSKIEIEGICREFGYTSVSRIWYKMPGSDLERANFHLIVNDDDAMFMTDLVIGHEEIHVFLEHHVDNPILVDEDVYYRRAGKEPVTQHLSDDNDVVDSSDSGRGDGKGSGLEGEDVVNPDEREFVEDSSDSWDGCKEDVIEPEQMGVGVMNFDYDSEELHNLDESSSDDDIGDDTDDSSEDELKTPVGRGRGQRKTFPVFKSVAKAEHIKFEKDMLFTTLKQFKEVIIDYVVNGGWGIRFVKNDLQRGLVQTFIDNWPQYEHRICCRHLYNNLRKNHPGVLIRELFWKVAKATYKAEFDRLMDELKGIDEDAHSWLQDHSTTILARHMFIMDKLSQSIAIIPVQYAHLQSMCNIPNQYAFLILPECTMPDQHALLI
nr:hypothetical protein CFP56_49869 [Quercus suber]